MSEIQNVKDVLGNLYKLDVNDPVYIVSMEYVTHEHGVCSECGGARVFKHGNCTYKCAVCGGTGKYRDYAYEYVVNELNLDGKYPKLVIDGDKVMMSCYYSVRGFFNSKKQAQELADKLNRTHDQGDCLK